MWPIGSDPVAPEEAIAWFRRKVGMTKDEYDALSARAKQQAFTVAGVAKLDVVKDVYTALDEALKNGTGLDEFKSQISDTLIDAWHGSVADPGFRLETIFRTNVQNAYSAGRLVAAEDPQIRAERPYYLFDAVGDTRTSSICRLLNGVLLPADDSFWDDHTPPCHFNCRSQLITLSEDEAKRMGGTTARPRVAAAKGFGAPPHRASWKPDLSDYPPALRSAIER